MADTLLTVEEAKAQLAAAHAALATAESVEPIRVLSVEELRRGVSVADNQLAYYARRKTVLLRELASRGVGGGG